MSEAERLEARGKVCLVADMRSRLLFRGAAIAQAIGLGEGVAVEKRAQLGDAARAAQCFQALAQALRVDQV